MTGTRIPWRFVEPLTPAQLPSNGGLQALEALRQEWQRYLSALSEAEKVAIRRRSLRRLAIETGILERLYDVDWGLTLTLVAEGFYQDVVERAGGRLDDGVLETLRAQHDALQMVLDLVNDERPLTTSFIKELHHAITRTQTTYWARDALGRPLERSLAHGAWKTDPNHVELRDGTILEYTPPEHVPAEMDRLIGLYSDLENQGLELHPLIKAGWLHHRFVQIHPFADGNGRVARALTLLVMQKHHYAPLVVDRWHRRDYLDALDAANVGDLRKLVTLFVKLEQAALTSELERPVAIEPRLVTEVAHTLAAQIAAARQRQRSEILKSLHVRSVAVGARIRHWFQTKATELKATFDSNGVPDLKVVVYGELPPESQKNHWFRRQVIESARRAGHFADFGGYVGYVQLFLRVEGMILRFVASLHGAGRESGVMAVTTFGILSFPETSQELGTGSNIATSDDAFRFVHTEGVDAIEQRASELEEMLELGLAVALSEMQRQS